MRLRQSEIGLGHRQRLLGRVQARLAAASHGGALVEGLQAGIAAVAQRLGPVEGVVGLDEVGLGLDDLRPGLVDRRLGFRSLGLVLGTLDLERRARQPRQHLAGGDAIALLGEQPGDDEAVDLRRNHDLVARDHRAGDDDALHDLVAFRVRDRDRRAGGGLLGGRGRGRRLSDGDCGRTGERDERQQKEVSGREGHGQTSYEVWPAAGGSSMVCASPRIAANKASAPEAASKSGSTARRQKKPSAIMNSATRKRA